MKKLSIIIPVYNSENTFHKLFESIKNQRNYSFELEVVICNDGSTDNSLEVIKSVTAEFENINIFDNENQGVYKTRNFALEKVSGDYVWMLDSDDYILPDSFSEIEKNWRDMPDVISLGYQVEDDRGRVVHVENMESKTLSGIEYLQRNNGRLFLWAFIYKLSFLDRNHLRFIGKSYSLEDFLFNNLVLINAKCVKLLKGKFYCYNYNENSISKKPSLENRLKQYESSKNVHFFLQDYINNLGEESKSKAVLLSKLKHSVSGFFYSLLKENYPLKVSQEAYAIYRKKGLLPVINYDVSRKERIFNLILNKKDVFILLSWLNNKINSNTIPK